MPKLLGADGQDFFLCWREEIDGNTVWFDGSLADFDSEISSRLCEFLLMVGDLRLLMWVDSCDARHRLGF